VEHTDWDDLDVPVRDAIQRRTGTVHRARQQQLTHSLSAEAYSGPRTRV